MTKKLPYEETREWAVNMYASHEHRILAYLCNEANKRLKKKRVKNLKGDQFTLSESWFRRLVAPRSSVNWMHNPGSIGINILDEIREDIESGKLEI